jgi:hypothetical protein
VGVCAVYSLTRAWILLVSAEVTNPSKASGGPASGRVEIGETLEGSRAIAREMLEGDGSALSRCPVIEFSTASCADERTAVVRYQFVPDRVLCGGRVGRPGWIRRGEEAIWEPIALGELRIRPRRGDLSVIRARLTLRSEAPRPVR